MRRRDVLAGAGLLAAASRLPPPAIAQGLRRLKMVTDWPKGSPGLQSSAERLAHAITTSSGGRITIEMFPSGALVRPFETFDAVSAGIADIYHSAEYYWEEKSPAFNFAQAKPNGDDLRFKSNTGERLPFQIEDWDAAKGDLTVEKRIDKIASTEDELVGKINGYCNRQ